MDRGLSGARMEGTDTAHSARTGYDDRFRLRISSWKGPLFLCRRSDPGSAPKGRTILRCGGPNLCCAFRRYPVAARACARSQTIQEQSGARGGKMARGDRLAPASSLERCRMVDLSVL